MDRMRLIIVVISASLAACSVLPPGSEAPIADDIALVGFYEDFLEQHPFDGKSDLVCFRLAMLHLKPDSIAFDLGKARTRLWQLAARSGSPYNEAAERVLALLAELERLRGETALKARSIELLAEDAARLGEAAVAAESRVAEKSDSINQLEQELESLRRRLGRLSAESSSQKKQIESLTKELQALKQIDVQ